MTSEGAALPDDHDHQEAGPAPAGTSRDAHLAQAAELLTRDGPADRGFRLRGAEVAAAAGLTRSALYKLWPSLVDLAEDTRRFGVTDHPDWRHDLLRLPPEQPLATTVATALDADPAFIALAVRAVACALPDGEFRREVALAELEWFDTFGGWLSTHLARTGRAVRTGLTPTDLAIAVTAAVEGAAMHASMAAGRGRPFWGAPEATALASVLERLLHAQTITTDHRDADPGPPSDDHPPAERPERSSRWSSRQRDVLQAILRTAVTLPFDDPAAPLAVRLVDLAALARHLGISRRRLEQLWPTPSDLNGDLFSFQVRRLRAASEQLAGDVLLDRLSVSSELTRDVLVTVIDAAIRAGVDGDAAGLYTVAFAVSDPQLSAVVEAEFADWRHHQQVQFFALVHAFGFQLEAEAEMATLTSSVFSVMIGAMRLAVLNPSLQERNVSWLDHPHPVLAVAAHAVFGTFTTNAGGPQYPARVPAAVGRPQPRPLGRSAQDPPPTTR